MNIKEEIDILTLKKNNIISEIDSEIAKIKGKCKHINICEIPYIDYDRNMYIIACLDCEATLFDGNIFQLEEYKKSKY